MIRKRITVLLLALAVLVFAAACGKDTGSDEPAGGEETAAETADNASDEAEETADSGSEPAEGSGAAAEDDLGVPYLEHPILADGTEPENTKHAEGYFTMTKGSMEFRIPDYYGELESKHGDDNLNAVVTSYYAATGDNLGMIQITGFDASETQLTDQDFVNAYYIIFDRKREDYESMENLTNLEMGQITLFRLNNGMVAATQPCTFTLNGTDCKAVLSAFNNTEGHTLMYVELIQAAGAEYDYTADYETIVLTAKSVN